MVCAFWLEGGRDVRGFPTVRSSATRRVRYKVRNLRLRAVVRALRAGRQSGSGHVIELPHFSLTRTPTLPMSAQMGRDIRVATYNVHRWTGINGRRRPDPARAGFVISEIDADIIALQEVLRPRSGEDPLEMLCDALGLYLAFAVTREHRRGQLGNAILSRYPITSLSVLDISHSRFERRGVLAAQFSSEVGNLSVVATHLSLVDRIRQRQRRSRFLG